jgi:hypothetical protein
MINWARPRTRLIGPLSAQAAGRDRLRAVTPMASYIASESKPDGTVLTEEILSRYYSHRLPNTTESADTL